MLTISKPLSASQARTYHEREFASEKQNYWSRNQQGHSEWQGKLAQQWKLAGTVESELFARLSEGQHPHTAEQLVRHRVSRTYEGKFGNEVTSAEHRAGWDATFSAPKSVSLTALVGGDERVREAHRESVRTALRELERYAQARIGNVHAPETTGKFVAATFEHDTARPVDGYAAPQLHTHAVIFNVTEQANGTTRSLQPHEFFVSQRYVTAIYRSELAMQLQILGYELEHGNERSAVQDGRAILETALARGMGDTSYASIRQEFQRRINTGEFQELSQIGARRQYTTRVMAGMEREIIGRMLEGNRRDYCDPMLVSPQVRIATEDRHPELNPLQLHAVDDILLSREKMVGLDGVAGAGKTTTLAVIRESAVLDGYIVEGFAPTSRAAQKLGEAGIETSTLQKHLARGQQPDAGEKRLYVIDESSLASTRQLHEFIERLRRNDRVLLVGDRRQHEAVEAGRPFAQLQDAGMKSVKLEEIVRQKDPALKEVVQHLARGNVREAVNNLDQQGRVHEIPEHGERISAIAKEYAKSPENTLVVSPDNRSRTEINERIHVELQGKALVRDEEYPIRTLVPRQELTGADRTWAAKYEVGDILRYSRASKETGIGKGQYAQVRMIDATNNRLVVRLQNGGERIYDPRRQRGVSVFREELRRFSVGDRIQFTAPANDLKIANRELGVIRGIDGAGRLSLNMDSGSSLQIDPNKHPHLDYGYAMTSHSSQGQTASRVLINVDTELSAKDLLNNRMAYVSVSRGAYDAQIFTNDREKLPTTLGHDVSKQTAQMPEMNAEHTTAPHQEISKAPLQDHVMGLGIGF